MDRGYGIQTLLMTDVVGSTKLWTSHPRIMPTAIECLEDLADTAIGAQGGEVVKKRGEGDSLFCVMPNPAAAARAATALVRSLRAQSFAEDVEIHIRCAIHCGPAHIRGADVFGPVPNRCGRIREVGHGDQILLSGAARAQIVSSDGIALRELGRHRLRDLDEPEAVYQVIAEDLPEEFPALRSLTCLRNNLPTQYTSFIGRETLRRELLDRLSGDRLMTLTGAGGSGKTRLSLQVGAEAIEAFPDGVWFVELADLTNETSIVRAVGDACGHRDLPDVDALGSLAQRLSGHGRALFLIDNAEHAILTIGRVVGALLAAAPDLRVLTTSREPLRLRGERVYRVPPLSVPPLDGVTADAVRASEAGTLFLDRARLRLPEFQIRDSNAKAIAEIVRRLDGIPLCLEMAASHVGYLGPDQIAARLHDRFALLDSDDPGAPPRHRTMRETIAWQYDTLREEEKLLLQRLAVFAGGFTLDAAEAVGGTPPLDPDSVLRHLRALVDKSLVVATPDGGEMRYRLLETIAQFASDQPEGETEAAMPLLLEWAAQYAGRVYAELFGPGHDACLLSTDAIRHTLRKAIDWGLASKERIAIDAILAMTRYWNYRGLLSEADLMLQRASSINVPGPQRADIDNAIGVFANRIGDRGRAEEAYRRVFDNPEASPIAKARGVHNLAILVQERDDPDEALKLYDEAVELANGSSEPLLRLAVYNRALLLSDMGKVEDAEGELSKALALYQRAEDGTRQALCYSGLANVRVQAGDADRATSWLLKALAAMSADADVQLVADVLLDAAWVGCATEQFESAAILLAGAQNIQDTMEAPFAPRNLPKRETICEGLAGLDELETAQWQSIGKTEPKEELLLRARNMLAKLELDGSKAIEMRY